MLTMVATDWKSDDEILKGNIARLFGFLRQENGQILHESYMRGLYYFLSDGTYKLADFGSSIMELKKFQREGGSAILNFVSSHLDKNPNKEQETALIEQAKLEFAKGHIKLRKWKRFCQRHSHCFGNQLQAP